MNPNIKNKPVLQRFVTLLVTKQTCSEDERPLRNTILGILNVIVIVMAFSMLNSDNLLIDRLYGARWITLHTFFRLWCVSVAAYLAWRAFSGRSTNRDFLTFLILGTLYAIEGTLLNLSYYLSFVQVILAVAWFSALPMRIVSVAYIICGIAYSATILGLMWVEAFPGEVLDDYLTGIWVAIVGAGFAGFLREVWQDENERLRRESNEKNEKLADLGRHLGMILHDVNSSVAIIKGYLSLMRDDAQKSPRLLNSIDKLDNATDHIISIQNFVLGMCSEENADLGIHSGEYVGNILERIVSDLCPHAKPYLSFHFLRTAKYYCSPSAVVFAVVNAVNNSMQAAMTATGRPDDNFAINVFLDRGANAETVVIIKDNGPGFSREIIKRAFKQKITIRNPAGHGLGLQNIQRYAEFQGGTVKAYNDHGATIQITIPRQTT